MSSFPSIPGQGEGGAPFGGGVNDAAFGPSWNGDTTNAASRNAIYDKVEPMAADIATNTANISTNETEINQLDSRVDALENAGGAAPTSDETYTIGVGQDYTSIQEFLNAHKNRPRNQYTITGTVQFGDTISTKVEQVGGDFTGVIVELSVFGTDCDLTTLPFEFIECHPAPVFTTGKINTTSLNFGEKLFHYYGCSGAIGGLEVDTTGGSDPQEIFYLEHSRLLMLPSSFPTYSSDSDHLFYLTGSDLYLDTFTLAGNSRIAYADNGSHIQSARGSVFQWVCTLSGTAPTKSPMLEAVGGSAINHGEATYTGAFNGTLLTTTDSTSHNMHFVGGNVFFGLDTTDSIVYGLDLDISGATFNTVDATGSDVGVNISNIGFDGGDMVAVRSTLRTNKADTVTYSEGSMCYTETLVTADPNKNTVSEDGIHMTP